jgi:hypothetical protein
MLFGFGGADQTLFLEGADGLSAELHFDLFAIDDDGLALKIWLPDLLGVALREADIVAVLLAFTGEITFLHSYVLKN